MPEAERRPPAAAAPQAPSIPDPCGPGRFHYAGLGGSGMSALAQFQVMLGGRAAGSDRAFDRGERSGSRRQLEAMGIAIHAQDGSGLDRDVSAMVVSTAVEDTVPDVAAAKALGIPIVHRSELLAHWVAEFRSIAVSGTSGKSTVVAMVFEILRACGRSPSVITGGDLVTLQDGGLWGNAFRGESDLLVVEADESDGSLVRYAPAMSVVLNLQRDHRDMAEVGAMFDTLLGRTREAFVVGSDANVSPLATAAAARGLEAVVFGLDGDPGVRGDGVVLDADASRFEVDGIPFDLPVPGHHNVLNALAAIATCDVLGVPLAGMVDPLKAFRGVGRRFQSLGRARGVEVIDDFAHNPAKIGAAIATAKRRGQRVLAVYQPHGYGPTRFLWKDFVDTFATSLSDADRVWLLEVFYAGGTAARDFSSADIVADIEARGAHASFAPSRDALVADLAAEARAGDVVLIMGARDPSLTAFAKDVLAALG